MDASHASSGSSEMIDTTVFDMDDGSGQYFATQANGKANFDSKESKSKDESNVYPYYLHLLYL